MKDYYKVLGVRTDADQKSIKKAYRHLIRQYHPDYNRGDSVAEEMTKMINEAYAILSDRKRKAVFDQSRLNEREPEGRFEMPANNSSESHGDIRDRAKTWWRQAKSVDDIISESIPFRHKFFIQLLKIFISWGIIYGTWILVKIFADFSEKRPSGRKFAILWISYLLLTFLISKFESKYPNDDPPLDHNELFLQIFIFPGRIVLSTLVRFFIWR